MSHSYRYGKINILPTISRSNYKTHGHEPAGYEVPSTGPAVIRFARDRVWLIGILLLVACLDGAFSANDASAAVTIMQSCPAQIEGASVLDSRPPDCRAYEMVSPPNKNAALIEGIFTEAAESGDSVIYHSSNPIVDNAPGNPEEDTIMATRGQDGWVSRVLTTSHEFPTGATVPSEDLAYSADLESSLVQPASPYNPIENDKEPLLIRDDGENSYEALVTPENVQQSARRGIEEHGAYETEFEGASLSGRHIVFDSPEALTVSATSAGVSDKTKAL